MPTPSSSANAPARRRDSLRNRLLISILPTVLVPLAVASAIGYDRARHEAAESERFRLQEEAVLTGNAAALYLRNESEKLNLLTADPDITQAARRGNDIARERGLSEQTIEQLEAQFADTKVLTVDAALGAKLRNLSQQLNLAEVFFTNRDGLNVAASNPTSDFVQRDEGWWQAAASGTLPEPEVVYDESAGQIVVEFVKRVEDPRTGEFLGALKAGAPIGDLQDIMLAYLGGTVEGTQVAQLLDTQSGEAIESLTAEGLDSEAPLVGGEALATIAADLAAIVTGTDSSGTDSSSTDSSSTTGSAIAADASGSEIARALGDRRGVSAATASREVLFGSDAVLASFQLGEKTYQLATVPGTSWVAVASQDTAEINAVGRQLLLLFSRECQKFCV